MEGQKVRVIVLTLANGETEFLIETLEDISKAYVLRWHIEETTQSRSRVREFFWRGCITRILGKLGHVQYIIASYHKGLGTQIKLLINFSVLFGVMRQKLYQVLVAPKNFQALFKYTR